MKTTSTISILGPDGFLPLEAIAGRGGHGVFCARTWDLLANRQVAARIVICATRRCMAGL